jgi:hypothetical protein
LGFEYTSSTMGIQDYMQEFDRADTIQVGVWVGRNSTIRIYGTSLCVVATTNMSERYIVKERLNQLMELEEDMILVGFHKEVKKSRDKSYHDRHIKSKRFKEGDLVFLYDSKCFQHLGKFRMHWLGPYEVKTIKYGGSVQLKDLAGTYLKGTINMIRLKLYRDSRPPNI